MRSEEELRIDQMISVGVVISIGPFRDEYAFNGGPKILYVGANETRFHFRSLLFNNFSELSHVITVCEIDSMRCTEMQRFYWINNVICNDIAAAVQDKWFQKSSFDLAIWSHGPATHPNPYPAINGLEHIAKKVVLLTPWGYWKQTEGIREIDRNKTAINIEWLLEGGYSVNCIGKKNHKTGNLLAWKEVSAHEPPQTPEAGTGQGDNPRSSSREND